MLFRSCLYLLDLSAVFDTLDHSILLHRLYSYFGLSSVSLFSGSLHTYRLAHLPSPFHRTSLPHPLLHVVSLKAPFSVLFCSIYTQPHLVLLSSARPPSLIYYTRMIHSFLSHLLTKTFLLSSQIYSQLFHLFHPGCHQIA